MQTFCVQVVFRGLLDEPDSGFPARLEAVLVGANNSDDATSQVERLAREREAEDVELPQGSGQLEYVGIRAVHEVELPAPPVPTQILTLNLEPDREEQIDALVDGGFVRAVLDR